jgi:hypothetical protein
MNKTVVLGAVLAFAIPVAVIFLMNGDTFSTLTPNNKKSVSKGTLLYFYSPS